MKKIILLSPLLLLFFLNCPETIKVINPGLYYLSGINTVYNEYNATAPSPQYQLSRTIVYSTDVGSGGKNYDIWKGYIFTNGWDVDSNRLVPFLPEACSTYANEYSPMFFMKDYLTLDQNDYNWDFPSSMLNEDNVYLFATDRSDDTGLVTKDLDMYVYNEVIGLQEFGANSEFDDAYPTYDYKRDVLYFCSNRADGVNFNIYRWVNASKNQDFDAWITGIIPEGELELVTVLNSANDEKCPYIMDDIMVFASNRSGGSGGYDLYFSRYQDGAWSDPVNFNDFDDEINTFYDEFRPTLYTPDYHQHYNNKLMLFSSDRLNGGDTTNDFNLYLDILPESF